MNASRFAARVFMAWLAAAAGSAFAQDDDAASAGGGVPLYGARRRRARLSRLRRSRRLLPLSRALRLRQRHDRRRARRRQIPARRNAHATNSSASKRSIAARVRRSRSRIAAAQRRTSLDLKLELQGCADRGLCYLPQDWTATVTLPPPPFLGVGRHRHVGDRRPVAGRRRVHDERALRQAERAHGRVADRAGLLPLPRQAHVRGRRPHRASARRHCPTGDAAHATTTSATSRCSTTTSRSRCRSRARAPTRSTSRSRPASRAAKTTASAIRPASRLMSLVLPATSEFPARAAASDGGEPRLRAGPVARRGSSTARGGRCSAGSTSPACCCRSRPACCRWCRSSRASSRAKAAPSRRSRGFLLSLSYVLGMAATYTAAGAHRRARGQPSAGAVPEALAHHAVRRHVRRAGARHVRPVRAADAGGDPDAAREHGESAERRHVRRHGGHRRIDGADRHDLRRAAVRSAR